MVTLSPADTLKKRAAEEALNYVHSGSLVGLGSGSTIKFAIKKLGELVRSESLRDLKFVASSEESYALALESGLNVIAPPHDLSCDVTIDGADEIDSHLNLVKGKGAALLREKLLAKASKSVVIIADESKYKPETFGQGGLPVEIIKFGYDFILNEIKKIESIRVHSVIPRLNNDTLIVTDNGNYIADVYFEEPIKDIERLSLELLNIVGIVEHGLFKSDNRFVCIISKANGHIDTLLPRSK